MASRGEVENTFKGIRCFEERKIRDERNLQSSPLPREEKCGGEEENDNALCVSRNHKWKMTRECSSGIVSIEAG